MELVKVLVWLSFPIITELGARENVTGIPGWGIPLISIAVTVIVDWEFPFAITHAWLEPIVDPERSFATAPPIRHIIAMINRMKRNTRIYRCLQKEVLQFKLYKNFYSSKNEFVSSFLKKKGDSVKIKF
jgi:hypothetical protein